MMMKRVATVVALCLAALSAQGQEACTNPKIVKTYSIEEVQQSEGYYACGGLAANTAMEEDKSRAFNCARRADGEGLGDSYIRSAMTPNRMHRFGFANGQRRTTNDGPPQTKRRSLRIAFERIVSGY
jgi:hypothetical protein